MVPTIYKYDDHLKYLNDLFLELKERKHLSAREFGKLLGYKSPSVTKDLFSGKRSIQVSRARIVAHRLGLGAREVDYFETLVAISQSADKVSLANHKKQLQALKAVREVTDFNDDWYAFFRNWRSVALLQILRTSSASLPAKEIGRILDCDAKSLKELLGLLERLKLVKHEGEGLVAIQEVIRTPAVLPVVLRPYYKDLLELARQKMDALPTDKRLVMGLMFAATESDLPKIQEDILEFIRTMNQKYSRSDAADQVYHLGVQCMPILSKSE